MRIRLKNRLEVLMKDSGVATFDEMARRLTENQEYEITRTPVSRKFRDPDVALPLKLIEAICNELQCLPGDLFETELSDVDEQFLSDLRGRVQPFRYGTVKLAKAEGAAAPPPATSALAPAPKRKKDVADDEDVTGPKVSHLSAERIKRKK